MCVVIDIFGKQGCARCDAAKKKVNHFLNKWGVADRVEISFHDMDTEEGMAEGMFRDVLDAIPVTIVFDDDGNVISRWDGDLPHSAPLKAHLVGS
jgi:hypothetical protein